MDIKELHSFKLSDAVKFHDELNPKLWVNNKLDPDVRNALLDVAEDFITSLGIKDINVEDVRVSGSNAAYSYTQHSDLDLHIIVDMSKLPDNEVYQELFNAKKTLYNDSHDITVHDVPVEVYVQDSNLPVVSLGEYSLLHNKWIRHPVKRRANFDQNATQAKYDKLADLVVVALKTKSVDRIDDILSLIKRYRKAGLSKGGEFSPENLAYKAIRSHGGIDKLYDLSDKLHSQALSIEEAGTRDDALLKIKKLQNTAGRTPSEIESIKRIIDKMMKQYNIKPEEIGQQQPVDPFKAKLAKAAYEKQMAAAAMKGEWERFKRGIFAEDEELDESEKTLLKTRRNPSPTALYNLTKRSAHQHLRGLYYNDNTYWWDADDAIHSDAAKELGIPYDYRNRLESAIGIESGNYNVIGDDGVPDSIIYRYKTEQLDEAYTTKQQVIDHFVRSARARGEDVNLAARKGAGAWERGWRGPKPKKPAEIKPYDPERYKNVRLPYIDEASEQINEIGFADSLTNLNLSDDVIIANSDSLGSIGKKPVKVFTQGTSTLYFFANDSKILALVLLNGDYLKAIKNFTSEKGMIYALLNYIVGMRGIHIKIAPSEPFTNEGFGWILRLATNTHGLRLTTASGEPVDVDKLQQEWEYSRMTKVPGMTGLVISEMSAGWKHKLIENENSLMPHRIFEYTDNVATSPIYVHDPVNEAIVYHVTPTKNVKTIMWNGLHPQIGDRSSKIAGESNGVFVFTSKADAENAVMNWLGDEFDEYEELTLLAIDATGLDMEPGANYEQIITSDIEPSRIKITNELLEASGYIPSAKEKNDPRFSTALTVDVKPDAIKKNAKAFGFKTSRAGIPPQAKPNGKITEALVNYTPFKKFESVQEEFQHICSTVKDFRIRFKILESLVSKTLTESRQEFNDLCNDVIRSLGSLSAKNLKIGNEYIPAQVAVHGNIVAFYDAKNNYPAHEPAEFGTLIKLDSDTVMVKIGNITHRYPVDLHGTNTMMMTVFLDSVEKYDQFRMMAQLQFDQELPPLNTESDDTSESFIQQLTKLLTENDDEQQELFPGYDEQHREKRLDSWLKNTHAWDGHKPMTFYHATTKDFNTFNTHGTGFASALGMSFEVERHGYFFAVDPKFAESFIRKPERPWEYKDGGRVLPVYLSVQNPIDLRDYNLSYMLRDEDTVEGFKQNDIDLWSIYRGIGEYQRWELFDGPQGGDFVENLQKLGFDGAIITEEIPQGNEAKSGEVWVAFSPNQIKSAVGNRGSFDLNRPELTKENR